MPRFHDLPSNMKMHFASTARLLILAAAAAAPLSAATVTIAAGTYTENFNSLGASGSNEPAAGWTGRFGASSSALGTINPIGPVRAWSHTTGQFKNVSSGNIASSSDATAQSANTDRAFALRQTQSTGNPGMSLNFNFASTGVSIQSISFDLLMLDVQGMSSTFQIQYGLGSNPASFTTLGTWSDPSAFGSTALTFDREDFGANLDNQSQAWFRIVALDPSTGTGSFDMVAIDNFSVSASSVPEPSAILLGGLAMLGFLRRRR